MVDTARFRDGNWPIAHLSERSATLDVQNQTVVDCLTVVGITNPKGNCSGPAGAHRPSVTMDFVDESPLLDSEGPKYPSIESHPRERSSC